MRIGGRLIAAAAAALVAPGIAAADDGLDRATVVFARGDQLMRSDGRGKHEAVLAKLASPEIDALEVDAGQTALIARVRGSWSWMPLDGTAVALRPLPCGGGLATLASDGTTVLCPAVDGKSYLVIQLATNKSSPIALAAADARLAGSPQARTVVWADASGAWSAPVATPARKTKVADPPVRSFLPSHDGKRAVGVYSDLVRVGRDKKAAELLMLFDLDASNGRRRGIRNGVPLAWSHDDNYLLVQDGTAACLMRANGGQFKCWKGYRAAAVADDASYALAFANGALYRVKLAGPFDETPERIANKAERVAAWLGSR